MTNDLIQSPANHVITRASKTPWGRVNTKRGVVKEENPQKYFELATKFAAQYPADSSLTMMEFDAFLENEGLIEPPPSPRVRNSKEWREHTHNRKRHREALSRAACHPRMRDYQCEPFELDWPRDRVNERIRVVSLAKAITHTTQELVTALESSVKRLKHRLQAFDQLSLSPEKLALLETCYEAINDTAADSLRGLERAHRKVAKLATFLNPQTLPPPDADGGGDS